MIILVFSLAVGVFYTIAYFVATDVFSLINNGFHDLKQAE
jgi:uncharacterized membrane protein (DUF373 family)